MKEPVKLSGVGVILREGDMSILELLPQFFLIPKLDPDEFEYSVELAFKSLGIKP